MRIVAGARRVNICDSYIGFGDDCQKAKNGLLARFQPRSVSKPLSDTSGAEFGVFGCDNPLLMAAWKDSVERLKAHRVGFANQTAQSGCWGAFRECYGVWVGFLNLRRRWGRNLIMRPCREGPIRA
jgi:hypothetical protein